MNTYVKTSRENYDLKILPLLSGIVNLNITFGRFAVSNIISLV